MKRTKALGVAIVVALAGSLLMGCSSHSATTNTASTPATSPTTASSPAATTPAATPLPGTDPIYRLEETNGLPYSGYKAALPGDLDVGWMTYAVTAVDPSVPSDDLWRGLVQRVALVPETVVALAGGHRNLDSFLLTALSSGEKGLKPDQLVDVEGVRVAQRDIGWGLSHYVWSKDGALFTYHGKPDWGDPFLATWFAHPELVSTPPTSGDAPTAASTTPAPATPSVSASSVGSITVALTDLVGHEGEHVAGVLLKDYPGRDQTAVAGFVTPIDADPFTQQQVLGNVPADFPSERDGMGWPWPTGVANVPPGDYTLMLWMAKDNFCCYSQWIPAQTPGLTGCQLGITATGEPQTITITGLPNSLVRICTTM